MYEGYKAKSAANNSGGEGVLEKYNQTQIEWFEIMDQILNKKRQEGPWNKIDSMGVNINEVS